MRSVRACGRRERPAGRLGQADHVGPVEVVRCYGGTATFAQLVARTSRAGLRRALDDGSLRRVRRGVYALPDLPSARKVVAMTRGVLSHTSAARAHGLEVPMADDAVHITVRPGTRAVRPDAVVTHWSPLAPDELGRVATSPVRTVLDCAMTLPFPQALAVADSALQRGMTDRDHLVAAALARRGAGRGACLAVARAADGRARNGFESVVRGTLLQAGVTGLVPQHPVDLPTFTAHVDLADVRRRIAIEADSYTYHAGRTAFGRDCERYDELVALDWHVLRVTWEHIAFEPEWVVRVVRATRALPSRAA